MRIKVEYSAQVRAAAGRDHETIEVDGPVTVGDLIKRLAAGGGEAIRAALLDGDGRPRSSNLICIGDDMARVDDPRPLSDGDVVAIIAPIAGG